MPGWAVVAVAAPLGEPWLPTPECLKVGKLLPTHAHTLHTNLHTHSQTLSFPFSWIFELLLCGLAARLVQVLQLIHLGTGGWSLQILGSHLGSLGLVF